MIHYLKNGRTMYLLEHYLNGYTPTLPLTSTIAYKNFPCKCTKWAVDNQETLTGFYYMDRRTVRLLKHVGVRHVERIHKNPYRQAGTPRKSMRDLIHMVSTCTPE